MTLTREDLQKYARHYKKGKYRSKKDRIDYKTGNVDNLIMLMYAYKGYYDPKTDTLYRPRTRYTMRQYYDFWHTLSNKHISFYQYSSHLMHIIMYNLDDLLKIISTDYVFLLHNLTAHLYTDSQIENEFDANHTR